MTYTNIAVASEGAVATVRVTRPDTLNALNDETLVSLTQAFTQLAADDAVRCVILTGGEAKKPAFVAGADIGELVSQDPLQAKARSRTGQTLCDLIEHLGKPVIAAINGFALGGGLELALACHIRLAAESARMGLPEVTLGIIPGYGGTQRLPRLVGLGRALELIASGRHVTAAEAQAMGLVNQVFADDQLIEQAQKLAGRIVRNGPLAVRFALESALRGRSQPMDEALRYERNLFGLISATKDMREGLQAFLDKRAPEFRNE
jgi:enoyl-CoA hydratase